jgi:hypothetical protein
VTTANNKNGGFSFYGELPDDCTGVLSDGTETGNVTVLNCTPSTFAPVPKTGQTTSYDTNNPPRDDGALKKGVAWPNPRFTDNSDGTVTDNLTGLIWLKNANCPNSPRNWQTALNDVASLNTNGTMNGNDCGDLSNQTDWRLPNVRELQSLVDYGFSNPARSNISGTGQAGSPDDPFTNTNFPASNYWSSTSFAFNSLTAWVVNFGDGFVLFGNKTSNFGFVIAVRGGS